MNKPLRKLFLSLIMLLTYSYSYACPFCDTSIGKQVNAGIFDGHIIINFGMIVMPFILFIIAILISYKYFINSIFEALILGGGIAGFFDGIFFHQIFQAHNMISNKLFPNTLINMEINMFWDGIFHAIVWFIIVIGIGLLWQNRNKYFAIPENKNFYGSLLLGFGNFNLIEGILNHEILKIHHVIQRASPNGQLFWDMTFLMAGAFFFIIAGVYMLKAKK